jgi:hypothetical protein
MPQHMDLHTKTFIITLIINISTIETRVKEDLVYFLNLDYTQSRIKYKPKMLNIYDLPKNPMTHESKYISLAYLDIATFNQGT